MQPFEQASLEDIREAQEALQEQSHKYFERFQDYLEEHLPCESEKE